MDYENILTCVNAVCEYSTGYKYVPNLGHTKKKFLEKQSFFFFFENCSGSILMFSRHDKTIWFLFDPKKKTFKII